MSPEWAHMGLYMGQNGLFPRVPEGVLSGSGYSGFGVSGEVSGCAYHVIWRGQIHWIWPLEHPWKPLGNHWENPLKTRPKQAQNEGIWPNPLKKGSKRPQIHVQDGGIWGVQIRGSGVSGEVKSIDNPSILYVESMVLDTCPGGPNPSIPSILYVEQGSWRLDLRSRSIENPSILYVEQGPGDPPSSLLDHGLYTDFRVGVPSAGCR